MKQNKHQILFLIALGVTFLTLLIAADESLTYSTPANTIIRGFPFHFVEHLEEYSITWLLQGLKILPLWFLASFGFWLLAVSAIYLVIFSKISKKKDYLLPASFILGLMLMGMNMSGASCDQGFPIVFTTNCLDYGSVGLLYKIFGLTVDIIYWFISGTMVMAFFHWMSNEKLRLLKYILIPVFLTLLSFEYEHSCGGFFCLLSGRGFPLPYYDNEFNTGVFLFDSLLWLLIYLVVKKIFASAIRELNREKNY